MKDKLLHGIIFLTLLSAWGLLLFFFYFLFIPKSNLQIGNIEIDGITHTKQTHVEHSHLIKGETVNFRVEICKLTDYPVNIVTELFDGEKDAILLRSVVYAGDSTCHFVVFSSVIPSNALNGEYALRVSANQRINFLRNPVAEKTIGGFEVLPSEHLEE